MALYVRVYVNDREVARASAVNITSGGECDGNSDYSVLIGEQSSSVTGIHEDRHTHHEISGHKRQQSVWALVEKIAALHKGTETA